MSTGQRKDPEDVTRVRGAEGRGDVAEVIPGSLASLDTTLPPTPLKKLLAADGASVYVLSVDVGLIEAVHDAAGEQYPVHTVAEWTELVQLVEAGSCKIVLIDADLVGSGLERRVEELHDAAAGIVLLVAAPRDMAQSLIGLLSNRSVHRLLIKPAAVGITRLLLESAVSRFLQLREIAREDEELSIRVPPRAVPPPASRMSPLMLSVALVSVLLGGLIAASFVRFWGPGAEDGAAPAVRAEASRTDGTAAGGEPAAPVDQAAAADVGSADTAESASAGAGPAEPAGDEDPAGAVAADNATLDEVGTAAAPDPFAALLEEARAAVDADRLAGPGGDNALDLYATVLASDPQHAVALAERSQVLEALYTRAERALLDEDAVLARTTIEQIRSHAAGSARFAFLEAQLESVESAAAAAREPPAVPQPTGELASLLTLATARLERGLLIAPAGDSAVDYLTRALAIQSDHPAVIAVRADLADAAQNAARLELEAGNFDTAEALADRAFELGADAAGLAQLDLDLTVARETERVALESAQTSLYQRGLARLGSGDLVAPSGDSALDYLRSLRRDNPTFDGLAAAWDQLVGALSTNASAALAAGNLDEAESWIGWLAATGDAQGEADAGLLAVELDAARLQASYLQNPAPAAELEIIERATVNYPNNALRLDVQGWVDLDLIVGRDGVPYAIEVVAAEPPGWFEDEALDAVSSTRWAPFERDGRIYERRARMRVRFGIE